MNPQIKVGIIIPSLEPSNSLLSLLDGLCASLKQRENQWIKAKIIIVDDGSGFAHENIFRQAESKYSCILLRHAVNMGKGRALKTAFNYFLNEFPNFHGVVTMDSDGQHAINDVIRCIKELSGHTGTLILGCRNFDGKEIPFKSRIGNKLTRNIFHFLGGPYLTDTQTGLRAIPTELLELMISISGERFEYEMNILIECGNRDINICEVPIETIYSENNSGTHFNPFIDSFKIYATFLKYIVSSIGAACIDLLIFGILISLSTSVAVAMVFSRFGGVIFNFTVNRNIVFKSKRNIFISALKYLILAFISGVASYYILMFIHGYLPLLISKMIAESILFFINYYFQKERIFNKP